MASHLPRNNSEASYLIFRSIQNFDGGYSIYRSLTPNTVLADGWRKGIMLSALAEIGKLLDEDFGQKPYPDALN